MANVFFKRGLQASLPSASADIVDGAFYLTTDTNRLYVGKKNASNQNVLVELNQSINTVSTIGGLPTNTTSQDIGQFYYVSGSNILCIYTGANNENNGWVQINPDTSLSTGSVTVGTASNNSAQVTTVITDTQNNSAGGNFTIVGGVGLDITTTPGSNGTITITPDFDEIASAANTTYTIETAAGAANSNSAKIQLNDNVTTGEHATDGDSEITITGEGAIGVARDSSTGAIKISASTDAVTSASFNNAGVLSIDANVGGSHTPGTVTPVIKLGGTENDDLDTNGYKFISGEATLPVYTKKEVKGLIDTAISTADAMTYKGSVSESTASSKLVSTANVGDTYKASESFTWPAQNGQEIHTGDLLVATGSDGNVTWEVIPSGDDQFIQGAATATSITISDNGETGGGQIAKMQLTAGAKIDLSGSSTTGTTANVVIAQDSSYTTATMSGGTGSVTQLGSGEDLEAGKVTSITYVTGFNVDAYGNVGGTSGNSITTQTLTLTDTHNLVQSVTTSVDADATNGGQKVTIGATQSDGDAITAASFTLRSDNITISESSANVITANLEWDTF